MIVCETPRLSLRHLCADDAAFILELLNEPEFIENIGDRRVRTLEEARGYILTGPVASYARLGFGLYAVELRECRSAVGICGLLKRECLEDVDVGFALLRRYRRRGYAFEAASAVMQYGRQSLGLNRIVAITSPDNEASISLLGRLGLKFDRMIRLPDQTRDSRLFS